jgi:hypothetical protein
MKLIAFNVSDGTVEIHKAGCADIKRGDRKRGSHQRSAHWRSDQVEFGKIDWPTKYDFCHDYWDNGILSEHEAENGKGSFDVWQGMDFKPCCNALPHDILVGSGEPIPEPAKPKTKIQVRREVREVLYNSMMKDLEGMKADVKNGYQPQMYADLMTEQIERVAFMFGMRDEK